MKCRIPDRDLFLYAENSLSAEAKDQIEAHLAECSECTQFLSFLKESMKVVKKDKEINPNPFLFTRILSRIENEKEEPGYSKKMVPAFVFSFLLVAGILGGVFMGSLYSGNSNYSNDLQEEVSYFNDIRQESIETFFLTIDDENE
jgi:Putative zinc-finger